MVRFFGAVCAVVLASASIAQAAEQQIVVLGSNPQDVRTKLYDAAEKLCAKARVNDPFNDFGSQDECVSETVRVSLHGHQYDSSAPWMQTYVDAK